MAAVAGPLRAAVTSTTLLPRLASTSALSPVSIIPSRPLRFATLVIRQLAAIPLLPAISLPLPSVPRLLEGIWESILRAVPKKKTSHMKKRHRQMAGKGLKDVTSLCKCPACGRTKRMHHLCPYCTASIREMLKKAL